MDTKKNILGTQVFGQRYWLSIFKTDLHLKLSTEKHARFLQKYGALFQYLVAFSYIY